MIVHRDVEIQEEEDCEEVQFALTCLLEGAEILIEQSERRGVKGQHEMVIPLDLAPGIRVVVIKEYGEVQH